MLTSSMSHLGVEVAPHMPMEFTPPSSVGSISEALSMRCEFALTCLHSLKRIFPLLLFFPLTKKMRSWDAANARMFGMRFATCRQMVS